MSKYTNNRSSQLLCIYIFTMFEAPFLEIKKKKKSQVISNLIILFSKLCCKRMSQPLSKFFVDLTTCNCILPHNLYNLIPIIAPLDKEKPVKMNFRTTLLNKSKNSVKFWLQLSEHFCALLI